jgi:ABC-type polysaccharide/polyol phosphate transport system ATPase subunit
MTEDVVIRAEGFGKKYVIGHQADAEKFLDTPVKPYSSGMYVRLAFVVEAHLEPEILDADEVLAVGDSDFQKKCLGKMSKVVGVIALFLGLGISPT